MKAVIQRVLKASVTVDGEVISSIGKGLCVLVGISRDDTEADMEYLARKLLNLGIFEDDNGKRWNLSVRDKNLEILCVSQFTLYHVLKGNKLDFHCAMPAESSEEFYNRFLKLLRTQYKDDFVKDGKFGAYMTVNIENDGPVTVELESPSKKSKEGDGQN
ncbi:D-aminoacyl-tRNA deacylase 1-like [Schistocerca piceifrons]|uniref:D-aminoacyl-tRNA deacylase 1-like n=1 Tax=Schistocerca piceifrons TaxID=274613 RepID=UPI001F5F211A|nr:D-aminoacyl-tRNA deacylase 1-like [Schistocerca piceifrons]